MSLEQDVFRKSRADAGRLKKYGFTKTDGRYIYERDFAGGAMRAVVEIDSEMKLTGKVFDKAAEDEYTAFRVQGSDGKVCRLCESGIHRHPGGNQRKLF